MAYPHFDVNLVPLVAVDCATMGMRRYVGRECTHEAKLEGAENFSAREIKEVIELFREDPVRAFKRNVDTVPMPSPVRA